MVKEEEEEEAEEEEEEAKMDKNKATTTTTTIVDKNKDDDDKDDGRIWKTTLLFKKMFQDKARYIHTMKVTLACCVSYVLSIWEFSTIIPPSQRYMIGVVVSSIAMSIPSIVCVVGLLCIVVPFIVIFAFFGATIVLCGVLISKGLMVVLFIVTTFWFSGLRFEHGSLGLVATGASTFILIANMISLSFYTFVEDAEEQEDDDGQNTTGWDVIASLWTSSGLTNQLAIFRNQMITICWAIICLWIIPLCPIPKISTTSRSLLSQVLAPQALIGMSKFLKSIVSMMNVQLEQQMLSTKEEENTSNDDDTEEKKQNEPNDDDDDEVVTAKKKKQQQQEVEEEAKTYQAGIQGLVRVAANIDSNIDNAELITFEPRLCKRPLEVTWIKLQQILQHIYLLITVVLALGSTIHHQKKLKEETEEEENENCDKAQSGAKQRNVDDVDEDPEKQGNRNSLLSAEQRTQMYAIASTLIEECATTLEQCATKLTCSSKASDGSTSSITFSSLKEHRTKLSKALSLKDEDKGEDGGGNDDDDDQEKGGENDQHVRIMVMEQTLMELEPLLLLVESLVDKVNGWDQVMNGPYEHPKSLWKGVCIPLGMIVQSWFRVPYMILKRLFYTELPILFHPSSYKGLVKERGHKPGKDFRNPPGVTLAWYIKYTIGVSVLYILQVYYPASSSFAIPVITADGNTVSFVGWIIIGYLNATTPTLQGTLKKGVARFGGTVLGAFSAWSATKVCGTYPNTSRVGLLAWLTIVAFVVIFWCIQPGVMSMMGQRREVGTLGMYFLMTQALIALEAVDGAHDINDLTLNRMVSQLVGITMAMIVAIIPPTVNGGHPEFTRNMILAERDALAYVIQSVLVDVDSDHSPDKDAAADDSEVDPDNIHRAASSTATPSLTECDEKFQLCMERVQYWKDLSQMLYKDATKLFPKFIPSVSADPKLNQTLEYAISNSGNLQCLYLHTKWLRERGELSGGDGDPSKNDESTKDLFRPIENQLRAIIANQVVKFEANGKEPSQQQSTSPVATINDLDPRVRSFYYYAKSLDEALTCREEELLQVNHTYFGTSATKQS